MGLFQKYCMGSVLQVKFVCQHGFDIPNVNSNVVLQTLSEPLSSTGANQIRDGTTTQRQQFQRNRRDCTTALQQNRALEETCQEYHTCAKTERNGGNHSFNL